jgi:hypothetical protein
MKLSLAELGNTARSAPLTTLHVRQLPTEVNRHGLLRIDWYYHVYIH